MSLIISCTNDRHNHPELNTGKKLFNYHCSRCHQQNGMGSFLRGIPANIATEKNQTEIILHLQQGLQTSSPNMPVFSSMPEDEAQKITRYLLKMRNEFFTNPENAEKFLLKRQY